MAWVRLRERGHWEQTERHDRPYYPPPFFAGTYFNRGCCSIDTAACPEGDETQEIVVDGEYRKSTILSFLPSREVNSSRKCSSLYRRMVTRCNETNLCNGNDDEEGGGDEGGGSAILIEGKEPSGAAWPHNTHRASVFIATGFSTTLWMMRLR